MHKDIIGINMNLFSNYDFDRQKALKKNLEVPQS